MTTRNPLVVINGDVKELPSGDFLPSDTSKQDTLVSGTNIKTVNGTSLLGSGNVTISGSGGNIVMTMIFGG